MIPYTTDTDFSTWSKYLNNRDISNVLLDEAPKHNLKLFYRFGEPIKSLEYSFVTKQNRDKVDMFITYPNGTHFLQPIHVVPKHIYTHTIYPIYQLCSIELLGYKLLAPCDSEKILLAEYGPNWRKPNKDWNYASSSFNYGPSYPFPSNIPQYTEYKI